MKSFLEHIEYGKYEGKYVPLERPMVVVTEDENKEINKPKRGGSKKFYVYVTGCLKDKKKVKKISFGDPNMKIKKSKLN